MMAYQACVEASEISHKKTAMLRRVMANRKVDLMEELHPKTEALVNGFASALKEKLLKAQQKYGYSDNWAKDDWEDICRSEMMRHIGKGDPIDVAAYTAFMWNRGWSTSATQVAEAA